VNAVCFSDCGLDETSPMMFLLFPPYNSPPARERINVLVDVDWVADVDSDVGEELFD
jgi:hypothetical protein